MSLPANSSVASQRLAIRVRGKVQGVGFRPHVYKLAQSRQFTGWVRNDGDGVMIEVQGHAPYTFVNALQGTIPGLARIDQVEVNEISPCDDEQDFRVSKSVQDKGRTLLPPDTAVCPDCLTELFDPHSRYYRYPFLNCSHCTTV